jgi:hypothetical protein
MIKKDRVMKKTEVDKLQLARLLLNSFRYALGRMTYVTAETAEDLEEHWDCIPAQWQELIQREIREAIDNGTAGMDCDVARWKRVIELNKEGELT